MAETPSTPAPTAPAPPAPDAPGTISQAGVDDLIAQMQAGNDAAGDATKAVQEAAGNAQDIAAVAQSAATPGASAGAAAEAIPAVPAAGRPVAAPPLAEMPVLPSSFEPSHDPFISSPELQRLLAIEVPLIVQLGSRRMSVGEVMRLAVGAIIEFNKSADEDLDLLANNRPIGKGQAVKVGENFGIKLTAMSSIAETIRKLGAVD